MAEEHPINANTPKNLDSDGKPLYPSVYEFSYIKVCKFVTQASGFERKEKEIEIHDKGIVTSLEIVEELYSPVVTAKMIIRDNINFFEETGLNGEEIIKIGIKRNLEWQDNGEEEKIQDLVFVVKDYSLFEKTTESINVQEYHLELVDSQAFLSRLQQVSIAFGPRILFKKPAPGRGRSGGGTLETGNPTNAIEKIYHDYLPKAEIRRDLNFGTSGDRRVDPSYECVVDDLKTVITRRTPLKAIEFLKSCCYDSDYSPFFICRIFNNTILSVFYIIVKIIDSVC